MGWSMKVFMLSLVVGFGLLASGCALGNLAGEGEQSVPLVIQRPVQQAAVPGPESLPPPTWVPGSGLTPPAWYWMEQPNLLLDRQLQQQWNSYYQNRIPPSRFPVAPICHSVQMNGQIVTNCF